MKPSIRGLTMIEMMVSMGMLALMLLLTFAVFKLGTTSFFVSSERQSIQNDARRLSMAIDRDLRSSNVFTVTTDTTTQTTVAGGTLVNRHAICFATVERWSAPEAIDPVRVAPSWDAYLVYYATISGDRARLVRALLKPSSVGNFPCAEFNASPGDFTRDDPATNAAEQDAYRILAQTVREFTVRRLMSDRRVLVTVDLEGGAGRQNRSSERFELKFDIKLENSR